jgi:hypothetical protein
MHLLNKALPGKYNASQDGSGFMKNAAHAERKKQDRAGCTYHLMLQLITGPSDLLFVLCPRG